VIVGSILLAFSIDASWEVHQEREVEARFLQALESDMAWNATEIERLVERELTWREGVDWFLSTTLEDLASISDDSASVVLVAITRFDTFEPRDASIRAYDLALIDDTSLRELLGEWSRRAVNADENRPQLVEAQHVMQMSRGQAFLDWVDRDQVRTGQYLAELRRNSEFLLSLNWKWARSRNNRSELLSLRETTDEILRILTAAGSA